jgi:hypothetical protein
LEGPANAWEWALEYGRETNLDRACQEIDEVKINWQEFNRQIGEAIKRNGWESDVLQPWNQTHKEQAKTAREREC